MSSESDLVISVPRACLSDFYNNYMNLVETFYYVKLTEKKIATTSENHDYAYFEVNFHMNPVEGQFNPKDIIRKIQVKYNLTIVHI